MHINFKTTITTPKVILVPYKKEHVPRYHEWMQNVELQELTASDPLSLEEEFAMQQSWLADEDKCKFIILDASKRKKSTIEIESMVGDVNLFLTDPDDKSTAEIEIMIAEPEARGKVFGKQSVKSMLFYGMQYLNIQKFTAKIGFKNTKSINLFENMGFKEASRSDYFSEVTLELTVTDSVRHTLTTEAGHFTIENHLES